MQNLTGSGYLIFEDASQNTEPVRIDWELTLGQDFSNGKSWRALISFPGDSVLPAKRVQQLIFTALSDPNVRLYLQIETEEKASAHISSIEDLSDCGVVELSSINLPRAWIFHSNP